jgi:hypothetical protein
MENSNALNKVIINDYDIKELDDIDFIATAISGWHLSVIYSYLLSLKKKLKGVIFVNPDRISEEMIVSIKEVDLSYIDINILKYQRNIISLKFLIFYKNNFKGNDFRILTPFGYNLLLFVELRNKFKQKNVHFIRFDEGIGSYLTEKDFNLFAIELSQHKRIDQLKIFLKLTLKKFLLSRLKNNNFSFESFFLFDKTESGLNPNEEVVKYLRKFYEIFSDYQSNYDKEQILIFKDYDIDRMHNYDIIEFYEQLIETLSINGKKIYIKKHPYDNELLFDQAVSKYNNVEIINNSLDAEMLYSYLNPIITVGGVSTCCFSIPIIFNSIVYNFCEMYEKYSIAPILKKEIILRKHYFPNDSRIIFIKSFDSIPKIFN